MKVVHSVVRDYAKYSFAQCRDVRKTIVFTEENEAVLRKPVNAPVSKPASWGHDTGASPRIGKESVGLNDKYEKWDARQSSKDWGFQGERLGSRAGIGYIPSEAEKALEQHQRAMARLSRMITRRAALTEAVSTGQPPKPEAGSQMAAG